MIDGIRRRLGRSTAGDHWSTDEKLKPASNEITELPGGKEVLVGATEASGHYSPDNLGTPDYYKSQVQTAIENGGRLGSNIISIPWLRMILAGLESKQIEPEMMWYGIASGETRGGKIPEIPTYEDLFQSSRDN